MRILVLGAGGIGGTIAGRLAQAQLDVTVCARRIPEQQEIRFARNQITESVPVRFVSQWGASEYEIVIIAVRPNQVELALAEAAGSRSTFVVCQNGLCEPLVRRLVGPDARVIGAVISWAASRTDGVVHQTTPGLSTLGALDGEPITDSDPVFEVMARVHPIRLTTNLTGVRWSKLALNVAASALCILVDGRLGKSFTRPRAIYIAMKLIEEVCAAAVSAGVKMEPIAGTLDLSDLFYPPDRGTVKKTLSMTILITFALGYHRLESSMWRAMKVGESSGMEFLCGPVIGLDRNGGHTRWNRAVLDVVNQIEMQTVLGGSQAVRRVYELARAND